MSVDDLKPIECDAITVTNLLTDPGSGEVNGTDGNDFILAYNHPPNKVNGLGGDDCIVGSAAPGAGAKRIDGGSGYDVCLGGNAYNYSNCEEVIIQ
jgi:hypothetical protein